MARRKNRPNTKAKVDRSSNREDDVKETKFAKVGSKKGPAAGKSSNDPAWYAANPVILRDAASYPFSFNTGATEIHDAAVWNANTNIADMPFDQIAGICSLHVYPCIGTALDATDPINVAAQSVYSFVRHANSGSKNYDPADLMMYILAMANMYSFLVWCQRAYGYALTYDQRNRYIPNDLLRSNNIDAGDLIDNLANFRFWINTLIAKMVSFAVPATMSVFSRMSFMYRDYYIEGTSIKDQLYQYVPEGFYEFGIDSASLGELKWKPFDYSTLMSTADIITYGNSLFNAIWSQEDFGIMSGDILKAYGLGGIIKLSPLPEYYSIVPKFDPYVLTQMKNADLVRLDPARISQDPTTGNILQTILPSGFSTSDTFFGVATTLPSAMATIYNTCMVSALKDYRILTVDMDDPGPDMVIETTRLKVAYDPVKNWYKTGTELIRSVVLTVKPGVDTIVPPYILGNVGWTGDKANVLAIQRLTENGRNFHYMPRYWVMLTDDQNANKVSVAQEFDIDNFTLLTYEDVRKLHEAATINMFAVPSIGRVE